MTPLGIVADDFTGATDVAGLSVRRGGSSSVLIDQDAPGTTATVAVRALKIRTAPRDEATRQAVAAARRFADEGRRLYWKYCSTFDSTPDGNIGPVADALLDLAGARIAIHCPAFPENRRTVYKGHLFVGDQPLDESPMRDHPLTPMRDASLVRLLAPQVRGEVGLVTLETIRAGGVDQALAREIAAGRRHVVADAITDADLDDLAGQCPGDVLLCGGSAFAARVAPTGTAKEPSMSLPDGPVLVLSGSCSSATQAQVAAWTGPRYDLLPIRLAEEGSGPALDWMHDALASGPALLSATAAPDMLRASQTALGTARAAALVEDTLAALAVAARNSGVRGIVLAGGETSGAVTTALGIRRLEIGREVAPGVPVCRAESGGRTLGLVLKSGNFGDTGFFADAIRALKGMA